MESAFAGLGAILGIGAAVLWLWASLIKVPDNLDTFIGVLRRIGRLNAWAAFASALAATCAVFVFLFHV